MVKPLRPGLPLGGGRLVGLVHHKGVCGAAGSAAGRGKEALCPCMSAFLPPESSKRRAVGSICLKMTGDNLCIACYDVMAKWVPHHHTQNASTMQVRTAGRAWRCHRFLPGCTRKRVPRWWRWAAWASLLMK